MLYQKLLRSPLGRIALFLYLCEDALRLIILAVRASWHFAIALDLLLPTHVASLRRH